MPEDIWKVSRGAASGGGAVEKGTGTTAENT
jgi:hypothetical protein